jgi:transglutaminase-like putative cysteine protease
MNRSRYLVAFVCAATLSSFFAAHSSLAQEPGKYDGAAFAPLQTAKIVDAARQITTSNYPDCDEATVDKKMVRVYRADGTGECQDESFVKVLTEKGKRGNRTLSMYYMMPYSVAEAVTLEVIKPDGKAVRVDIGANSKEMIDDSQMGMNIYDPNSKIIRVNIPALEVGDLVHSITRTTIKRPIIPGEFADDNVFEGSGYIRHLTYEIYAPGEKPLKKVVMRDEVAGTIKNTTKSLPGNGTLHRWEVTNVPRMFDEPAMPPYEITLQRLLVSTTPSWEDVSKWYWNVCKPHLDATNPEMKKTVEELTASSKTDLDKIKAVFHHVSNKIRYMGLTPEKDRPGFEPHDVCLTFNNKYGVCRDKAALLVSMLSQAGFDAYPVLVNVGMKRDKDAPEPSFNHAIVGVELKPGEHILMDPTAENTKELLPAYECDQSYLLCKPNGDTLRTSPIVPAEENMMRIKTTGTLTSSGILEAKSELAFDGINDNQYREAFSHMKPDDKRRFFERSLKRSIPGAKLKSLKLIPEDMLDVSTSLRAELEYSAEGMIASGGDKAVVTLPWIGKGVGLANFILGGTGLEKRKYPLRTEIACGLSENISLQLDRNFAGTISMPSYTPITEGGLTYKRQVDLSELTLAGARELKLNTVEFSPAEYLKLKKDLVIMDYDDRKTPVLSTSGSAVATRGKSTPSPDTRVDSNAEILSSHKEMEITDAHTEVLKGGYVKKILTYSGKKTEAEFKLGYNPACEDAKIVRAVVTSKTGQRQEITTNEVNVMDAGWNASAKRYTGGKVLVANLPGVDIGSTIEIEYELTFKNKPFLATFEPFQTFDDLHKKDVRLTAPAGLKVQTMLTGPTGIVKQQTNSANGSQVFEWHAENIKALPAESLLPPEWMFMAGVNFFAGDQKAYLDQLSELLLDRSGKAAAAGVKARELTASAKNKREAVKSIRDFVASSIRHGGPSFSELPLSELSAADVTLADGYGHMADRAILLHAMLKSAGFKPEFVLASGLPPIAGITNVVGSFPLLQNFQAVLVRVPVDGELWYLNDTDQYAHPGSTGFDDKLGIMLASQSYDVIHAANDCRDKTETTYSLSLSDNGKTRLGITHQYYGGHFNSKHRYFAELPPEERRRYYQELVSGVAQGARPVGDLVTKFDSYPATEQFTVEIDNYAVVDGKYSYFDLPFTPSLLPVGADHRQLPLFVSYQSQRKVRTEIDLPPKYQQIALAPKSEQLEIPKGAGKARITQSDSGSHRVITHEFETSPAILGADDYPAILDVEAALGRKASRVFLLQTPDNLP